VAADPAANEQTPPISTLLIPAASSIQYHLIHRKTSL
jgi:hypothetical protein